MLVSSANRKKESSFELLWISLIYSRNSNGPNTEPCGTPHKIVCLLDNVLLYFTI